MRKSFLLALLPFAALATSTAGAQCAGKITVKSLTSMNTAQKDQIYQAVFVNKSAPTIFHLAVLNPPADFIGQSLPASIRLSSNVAVARNLGRGGVHNFSLSNVKVVYDNQPANGFAISISGCTP